MTRYGTKTATGTRHETNEDSVGETARRGVWLVADGMGGHAAGDAASQIVRATMLKQVAAGVPLSEAIEASHQAVIDGADLDAEKSGMGSTVVALKIDRDEAELAWVGDSRGYLFRDGELSRLTTDHSYVQYLFTQGQISAEEMETHPQRNVLTQTLGFDQPKPDAVVYDLEPNDQLLLCSDGVTVEIPDDEIAEIMAAAGSPQQAADNLVAKVVERHGKDDASAIVVHYKVRSTAWVAVTIGVLAGLIAFLTAMWVKSS
jgi:serine/threonine protein phosphatase PrpC